MLKGAGVSLTNGLSVRVDCDAARMLTQMAGLILLHRASPRTWNLSFAREACPVEAVAAPRYFR
jgi:hypothetical protein